MSLGLLSGFVGYNEQLHQEEWSHGEGHCRNDIAAALQQSDRYQCIWPLIFPL